MNILITGATGFVGRNLTRYYVDNTDHNVTVIVRDKSKVEADLVDKITIVVADMNQYSSMRLPLEEYDLFYHFAWNGTSGPSRKDVKIQNDNVKYTCDAVFLAQKYRCEKFINAGSIMEYECIDNYEKNFVPPESYIYNISKFAADYEAQAISNALGIEYVSAVISNIYGVGEISARFINVMIRKMIHNEAIDLSSCEQLYDFIYISDAVRAISLVGEKGINNTRYYIGNQKLLKLKEFIIKMYNLCNSSSELKFGMIKNFINDDYYKSVNIGGIYELGFIPKVSFEEGIILTRDWLKEYGNEF